MPPSEIDLDAIEARCGVGMFGAWKHDADGNLFSSDPSTGGEIEFDVHVARFHNPSVARAVTWAHTDLPALVARVRELEAERDALRETQAERSAEVGAACAALVEAFAPADARDELRCAGLARLAEVAVARMAELRSEREEFRLKLADIAHHVEAWNASTVAPERSAEGRMHKIARVIRG